MMDISAREKQHSELYRKATGHELNFAEPSNLNEKLQWLMVYKYDENVSPFADKLIVRDYVRACGYGDILTGLYGVWDNAADIDFAELPAAFALKCNHGSGAMFYTICKDKSALDVKAERQKFDKALTLDFSKMGHEYHYHYIQPLIYAEELLEEENTGAGASGTAEGSAKGKCAGQPPIDYKFFCFAGEPRYVKVIAERGSGTHQDYYDMDWNFCPFVKDVNSMGGHVEKPAAFERMKEIAASLSKPFPMARVDLYYVNGNVYFGEITLTPATGLNRTDKQETLELLGSLMDVNAFDENALTFTRTDEVESLLEQGKSAEKDGVYVAEMSKTGEVSGLSSTEKQLFSAAMRLLGERGEEGADVTESVCHEGFNMPENASSENTGMLNRLSREQVNMVMQDCVHVMTSDAALRVKEAYMNVLYRIAFREDLSLEECWQIFRDIDRLMFVNHNARLYEGSLDELYRYIFEFVQSQIDYSRFRVRKLEERNRKLAVVVTSQLLRLGHAPTRRVLDYSYVLQHDLGYKVIIINDAGMHYYHCDTMQDDIEFTFLDEYTSMPVIEHRGETFDLLQVGCLMPDLVMLQQLVDMVYELNPMFVYNIGASCLTSDLCDPFVTVASLPCSMKRPIATCRNLILGRAPEEQDYHMPCDILPGQRLIESVHNFTFAEAPQTYHLADFVSGDGSYCHNFFACCVGYRLGAEIDALFTDIMIKALEAVPQLVIILIGEIAEDAPVRRILDERLDAENRKRVIMTGGLRGASALVKQTQLMLNPDRSGGGRGVFEALHYGIPVVSLRRGDGYYGAGKVFGADNLDDYVRQIVAYANDKEFYAARREAALKRAAELDDMPGTQKKVVEKILFVSGDGSY